VESRTGASAPFHVSDLESPSCPITLSEQLRLNRLINQLTDPPAPGNIAPDTVDLFDLIVSHGYRHGPLP
jgi:hypothetical protein